MNPVMPPISGLVITFNEADRIGECLRSMAPVCRQLIVLDAGSTDGTIEVAKRAGARVVCSNWKGFAGQRNAALALASQPWSLFLDADERLSPQLIQEILAEFADSARAEQRRERRSAYDMRFRTLFLGRQLRFGAPGSEHHVRLFRTSLRFHDRRVHERVAVEKQRIGRFSGYVLHHTARDLGHYERKLASYAELFAKERAGPGKRATLGRAWSHALYYLLKNYWVRGGFLDGWVGYLYHRLHAGYVFAKYARLWEQRVQTRDAVVAAFSSSSTREPTQ